MSELKRYECNGSSSVFEYENGSLVDYEDYAALEAKCAVLAAENAGLKSAIPQPRDVECDNDNMDDVSLAEDFGFNHAIEQIRRRITETPATDTFMAEVRAQGVELFAASMKVVGGHEHPYSSLAHEFAAQLRKGGNQ